MHIGTLLSYAKDSKETNEAKRIADFNHFVIFDTRVGQEDACRS